MVVEANSESNLLFSLTSTLTYAWCTWSKWIVSVLVSVTVTVNRRFRRFRHFYCLYCICICIWKSRYIAVYNCEIVWQLLFDRNCLTVLISLLLLLLSLLLFLLSPKNLGSALWEEFLNYNFFQQFTQYFSFAQNTLCCLKLDKLSWYKIGQWLYVHIDTKNFSFRTLFHFLMIKRTFS